MRGLGILIGAALLASSNGVSALQIDGRVMAPDTPVKLDTSRGVAANRVVGRAIIRLIGLAPGPAAGAGSFRAARQARLSKF